VLTKALTLTNTGDFTINFPTFGFPPGVSLISNLCGGSIDPKQSCVITFQVLKTSLGLQTDNFTMTSTSKGSGTTTLNLSFTETVLPGSANGNISFDGSLPAFVADGVQTQPIVSGVIQDQYGNTVADGTPVIVQLTNLNIVGSTSTFTTVAGRISFTIRSTTTKGSSIIAMFSGNAYGSIPIYLAAGQPYGSLTLQPYNSSLIADGVTQLILRTNTIYDKFGNSIEDGTQIPIAITGGGNVSTNSIVYAPALTATSFSGAIQFTIRSGTVAGSATVNITANPTFDTNMNILGYAASGSFPVSFVPGPPTGNIIVSPNKAGMNAVGDFTLVSIGPLKDVTGNVVNQGTTVNFTLSNGINSSGTGSSLNTDASGMVSFELSGTGNRGYVTVAATAGNANGSASVWAYKASHLTLQGQLRDDTGVQATALNAGRMAIRYYKATNDTTLFPPINDLWDEIFDYTNVTNGDRVYYDIERFNGSPISTLGNSPGNTFPVLEPSTNGITSKFIDFAGPTSESIPYYLSPVWYAAGANVLAAPFWTLSPPPPSSRLVGCGETTPDGFGNYLYNLLMFTISDGYFGCDYNGTVVTTNSTLDRQAEDTRSNLYYPSVGYVEDPIGCSFSSSASPVFNFNLGTFFVGTDTTRQIQITNPNPTDLTNLTIAFATGTDPNWTMTNTNCGATLPTLSTCTITVAYNNTTSTLPGQFSANMSINSSAVSSSVVLGVTFINTGTAPAYTGIVGAVTMKSNCYAKLVTFGGYNYQWTDSNQTATIATNSKLVSTFNSRGQILSRVDNNCSSFNDQTSCLDGNGCSWTQPTGSDPTTAQFSCNNTSDLGTFPTRGKGFAPFVAVGRKLYTYGGYDPTGDGQPSSDELMMLNTETNVWTGVNADPDNSQPITQTYYGYPQPRYEHAMVYVPETTSLYLYGGVGLSTLQSSQNQPIYFNDLWQLNLSPAPVIASDGTSSIPDLKWKMLCSNCVSLDTSTIFEPIKRNPVSQGPGFTTNPGVANLVWNKPRKQLYLYWEGKPYVYSFDPTASTIEFTAITASSGANSLGSSYQVMYNPRQERMYAYNQGTPASNINPSLKMWDMDINEKLYTKTRFNLGAGAKQFAAVLTPRVKAYGSAGADPSCGDPCPGVTAYIYNYATNAWDIIGNNTATTDSALTTQGEISNSWINTDAQNHISTSGYVDILMMPNGIPQNYNQVHIDYIFLDGTF
jgi:hypothetical protein